MLRGETIAAISTPPGMGGIAVIRISGENALDVAAKVFEPKNEKELLINYKGYRAAYGAFLYKGQMLDDGVALVFRAPHSYTGEDVVELSCHGGSAVSQALLSACVAAGASPALPGEYTRRAVLNGRMDLAQAEAVMELIGAETSRGAAAAHRVLAGALQKELNGIKADLIVLAGHLAACVDYPEEDVEELTVQGYLEGVCAASTRLVALIAGFERGQLLRRGVAVAIVGAPNVGKSTLFNLLFGSERAIVTDVAGTTRDVLREAAQIGGVALHLADTAGLRQAEDVIEKEGINRSLNELENAGLIIAVFDASKPWEETELELAKKCAEKPALALLNKSDLGEVKTPEAVRAYFEEVLCVSARREETRGLVEGALLRILGLERLDTDTPLLTGQRQLRAACAAQACLENSIEEIKNGVFLDAASVCLEEALVHLAELTGENASEAVIDEVFSRFCVGK